MQLADDHNPRKDDYLPAAFSLAAENVPSKQNPELHAVGGQSNPSHETKALSRDTTFPPQKNETSPDGSANSPKQPENFEEFWPIYLRAHSDPRTRAVHYLGTSGGVTAATVLCASGNPGFVPVAVVATYAVLFASHYIFEKNAPVTLGGRVLWSMRGDFRMLGRFLSGRLKRDLEELQRLS